jgi:c-di-GMP-binding flagellar brake protein YcgR
MPEARQLRRAGKTWSTPMEGTGPEASTGGGLSRREAYRTRVDAPVAVYVLRSGTTTPGWLPASLHDLSASGAGIEALTFDAEPGDEMLVRFHFGAGSRGSDGEPAFQHRCMIVRAVTDEARTTYGVRFLSPTAVQVDALHALVIELTRLRQRVG